MQNNIIRVLADLIPGFIGAVLALRFNPDVDSWGEYLTGICGGTVAAYYGTPFVVDLLAMQKHSYAFAFVIGLFSMALFSALFRALANADLWALIREVIQMLVGRFTK